MQFLRQVRGAVDDVIRGSRAPRRPDTNVARGTFGKEFTNARAARARQELREPLLGGAPAPVELRPAANLPVNNPARFRFIPSSTGGLIRVARRAGRDTRSAARRGFGEPGTTRRAALTAGALGAGVVGFGTGAGLAISAAQRRRLAREAKDEREARARATRRTAPKSKSKKSKGKKKVSKKKGGVRKRRGRDTRIPIINPNFML